jgi:peptide/nickel transport system permease protein
LTRYILRRILGSFPILIGVLLVTFVLFHLAAGDPAALVVGKNAGARELENVREQLGLNRPLLWGHWCRTERLPALDFRLGAGSWEGVEGAAWVEDTDDSGRLELAPHTVATLPLGWVDPGVPYRLVVESRGALQVQDEALEAERWSRQTVRVAGDADQVTFGTTDEGAELRGYRLQRRQENPWNSQFVGALREVVDLRPDPDTGRRRLSFFNFGRTLLTDEPIREVLLQGLGPSLALMIPVFVGELVLAIAIAMVSAYRRDTLVDRSLMVFSVASMSISYLVYILFGQYVLAYGLDLFPVWGFESWRHLLLPVIVGIASGLGGSVRFYRTVFLNELHQDHIRTARAKGCGPARILLRHVLPNAMIPILTRVSVVLPFLYTGSLLLESFFGIPGLGYLSVNALANADLQLLKALVLTGALLFVSANILADIAYAYVDPRIRLR